MNTLVSSVAYVGDQCASRAEQEAIPCCSRAVIPVSRNSGTRSPVYTSSFSNYYVAAFREAHSSTLCRESGRNLHASCTKLFFTTVSRLFFLVTLLYHTSRVIFKCKLYIMLRNGENCRIRVCKILFEELKFFKIKK